MISTKEITVNTTDFHTVRLTCNDCRSWCWEGERIRHSKRCDTPHAQIVETSAPAPALDWGKRQPGEDRDDWIERAYRLGDISMDEAMNQDM